MKSLMAVLSLSVILLSCSKQALVIPQTTQKTFYKDANIEVASMAAVQKGTSVVNVSFATQYEKNVAKIELMSGNTDTQLCAINEVDVPGNSNTTVNYSVDDTNLKGKTMYYMLRFTLTNGDWGFTPVVSVSVK